MDIRQRTLGFCQPAEYFRSYSIQMPMNCMSLGIEKNGISDVQWNTDEQKKKDITYVFQS